MNRTQKIKVNVVELIAAVEARKQEVVTAHEKELSSFPDKLEAWKKESLAILAAAVAKVESGKSPGIAYDSNRVNLSNRPLAPTLNVSVYNKTINTLKMSADETIAITVDDYGDYVR